MLLDEILAEIGEFGPYQIMLYILLGMVGVPTGRSHVHEIICYTIKSSYQLHYVNRMTCNDIMAQYYSFANIIERLVIAVGSCVVWKASDD